jgi:predicted nucleotidyltransferase
LWLSNRDGTDSEDSHSKETLGYGVLDTAVVETVVYCLEAGGKEENIMSRTLEYPQVTDELLQAIAHRILAVGVPYKIVLFGSQARGDARPDSDLDLLIIEDSDLPRYKRSARYLRVLVGLFPAKDVVVWTPEEVQEWAAVPHAFITTALREGKILYAQ